MGLELIFFIVGISTGLFIADRLPNYYYQDSPCGCFEEITDQDLKELQEEEKSWAEEASP